MPYGGAAKVVAAARDRGLLLTAVPPDIHATVVLERSARAVHGVSCVLLRHACWASPAQTCQPTRVEMRLPML